MLKNFFQPTTLSLPGNLGVLFLRVGVGLMMVAGHGYPKLQRLLGDNPSFGDPIGLGSETSLLLATFAEFFCSLLLVAGLFTRAALLPLLFTMLVALFVVHGSDPLAKQELPLLYALSYLTLLLTGPGKYSLDRVVFK